MAVGTKSTFRRLFRCLRRVMVKLSPGRKRRELRKALRDIAALQCALASEHVNHSEFESVLDQLASEANDRWALETALNEYRATDEGLRRLISGTLLPALGSGEKPDPERIAEFKAMIPGPVLEDLIFPGNDEYL